MSSTDQPLRLRAKVFTNAATGQRYLVSMAMFNPERESVHVYFMSDEETLFMAMTVDDYNALPYFYFKEDGEAPRPPMRVADAIVV